MTTSTGVYELQVPLTGTVGDTLPVTWMLTNEMYTDQIRRRIGGNDLADDGNGNLLRPILFKPRQARYLPNGNVLIVNGYNGTTLVRSGNSVVEREFPGEVFELNAHYYTRETTWASATLPSCGVRWIAQNLAARRNCASPARQTGEVSKR